MIESNTPKNLDDKIILDIIKKDEDNIGTDYEFKNLLSSEVMEISLEERDRIQSEYNFLDDVCSEIKEIKIKEFDYDQFKEDINDLDIENFNDFFNVKLMDIFYDLEDNYLFLNYEEICLLNSKPLIKEVVHNKIDMTEIIVEFIMFKLPYKYFKKLIKTENMDVNDLYNNIYSDDFKDKLIATIESDNLSLKNLGSIINSIKSDKKEKEEDKIGKIDSIENLNNNLNKRANINYYYLNLIKFTSTENLQNLLIKYLENDLENII